MIEIGKVVEISGNKVTIQIGKIRIQLETEVKIEEGANVIIGC